MMVILPYGADRATKGIGRESVTMGSVIEVWGYYIVNVKVSTAPPPKNEKERKTFIHRKMITTT